MDSSKPITFRIDVNDPHVTEMEPEGDSGNPTLLALLDREQELLRIANGSVFEDWLAGMCQRL